jgi:hypothetical protein
VPTASISYRDGAETCRWPGPASTAGLPLSTHWPTIASILDNLSSSALPPHLPTITAMMTTGQWRAVVGINANQLNDLASGDAVTGVGASGPESASTLEGMHERDGTGSVLGIQGT